MLFFKLSLFYMFILSERKVQPNEYPHSLYIANYSTAAATCLLVKKWLFDRETEKTLHSDPVAREFLFQQVRKGREIILHMNLSVHLKMSQLFFLFSFRQSKMSTAATSTPKKNCTT